MYNLTERNVVLGVTGSIAAYKAADLASKLTQAGARVDVIMSSEATRFVSPLTFEGVPVAAPTAICSIRPPAPPSYT
ncbi:MAG: flavoprotein [Dehalococcoidia bacterium]